MKKIAFFLGVFLFVLSNLSFSQDFVIEINNTNITTVDTNDFSQVTDAVYQKYIIKNNRNSTVVVSEIKTPSGFFANISDMNIGAGKKVILYVGLDPRFFDAGGDFSESIIVKTNLIMDIVINVKGTVVK